MLWNTANGLPATTEPIAACHAAAELPAMGPNPPKPTAPRMAGVRQAVRATEVPPIMPAAWYGFARIQAEMSLRRSRSAEATLRAT